MSEMLARNLSGKRIVGTDGKIFGRLHTVTMDPESGALLDLVVEPGDGSPATAAGRSDDDDRLWIPVDRIETVKDQIIVRSSR
ncbi:PRC-barrel domain-containing protein [Haloterrigena salinisoli]|uniref:PRC-barrel domain-containing protein n=1 Tax=Haloterrigena salinisoli TaxID=3132747 RepID=UPI0030CE98F1